MSDLQSSMINILENTLRLQSEIAILIVTILGIVVWVFIGIIVNRFLKLVILKSLKVAKNDSRAKTISSLLINISRWVIWFVILLIILEQVGVDITPLLASAGIIGLAVGFGAQELVKDFISGFFIVFEHTFDVNEVIESQGFKGTVVSMGLRTTVLKNWKGEIKTINNGSLGSIINYSRNNSIGIVDFGVSYDTDLKQFGLLMDSFIDYVYQEFEGFENKPKFLGVTELAESSINMRLIFETKPLEFTGLERTLRKEIVTFCNQNNIEIPFPQVVVHND
jgi:small conductance mechanosensitive channel